MKIKLSNKNRAYWINYAGYWLIFILISLALGSANYDDLGSFNFKLGFIGTSIIASFVLANNVAKKYRRYEEMDELRIKEGLEQREFNQKYGKLFDIIDK
jgi:uncharacterized membrane-anchored protein